MLSPGRRWAPPLVAAAFAILASLFAVATAIGASPTPSTAPLGDPRSSGQGPGLVGDPLAAILVVATIALLSLGLTLLYVRETGGPRRP